MPPNPQGWPPVMCLTQDGLPLGHSEQAERLCAAGARWIQLRMKGADPATWLAEARATARACRRHGAILVVNDSVEIALGCGADGVHLGGQDGSWRDARRLLGPDRIVGGSMNRPDDARRAVAAGCLDYVGVGPLRFTATKTDLSPLLGFEGTREIIALLRGVPAWVIGGVEASDAGQLRRTGAAGVAVSSSLYRGGRIEENLRDFLEAWAASPSPREVTS